MAKTKKKKTKDEQVEVKQKDITTYVYDASIGDIIAYPGSYDCTKGEELLARSSSEYLSMKKSGESEGDLLEASKIVDTGRITFNHRDKKGEVNWKVEIVIEAEDRSVLILPGAGDDEEE